MAAGDAVPLGEGETVFHLAVHHICMTEDLGSPGLHPVHRALKVALGGDHADGLAVHQHLIAGDIDGGEHAGHTDQGGGGQKDQRIEGAHPGQRLIHSAHRGGVFLQKALGPRKSGIPQAAGKGGRAGRRKALAPRGAGLL